MESHHPARIGGNGVSIGCSVVDLSADGASIDVPDAHHVPDRFRLVAEHGRVVLNCRILWINQSRIGVAFESV
ncbi:PilZ domain-containing protein [Nitrobacter sp. TKz-YC02]|uniref:PilZ domain-containing protein n=1 Tax=Nitrobacter sp. TKz-YC02 TaxID=3398704 RepID=UPI003CF1284A